MSSGWEKGFVMKSSAPALRPVTTSEGSVRPVRSRIGSVDVAGVQAQAARQLEAVEAGQADVEEDEIGIDRGDRGQPSLAVREGVDAEAFRFEEVGEQRPVRRVVLDDEDRSGDLLGGGEGRPRTLHQRRWLPLRSLGLQRRSNSFNHGLGMRTLSR